MHKERVKFPKDHEEAKPVCNFKRSEKLQTNPPLCYAQENVEAS